MRNATSRTRPSAALILIAAMQLCMRTETSFSQVAKAEPPQTEHSQTAAQSSSSSQTLPDAPSSQDGTTAAQRISPTGKIPAILAPQTTRAQLSAHDKFVLYEHQALNPLGFALPALGAGINMARPKNGYPPEWRDGGDGYGRLIGDRIAKRQSEKAAQVLTQVAFHEDPRYLPLDTGSPLRRTYYALKFTLIDRSDSGRSMPALSNFSGAAASGFVGMDYLPDGFNDATHAGQFALTTMGGYAVGNALNEFCPQWSPLVLKLHVPFVHPPCAERMHTGAAQRVTAQKP